MRLQSSFTVGFFFLLIIFSCDISTSEARRCTRICEKGRCKPVCLRDASIVPDSPDWEVEPMRSPDGP